MAAPAQSGHELEFDGEGYLIEPRQWDEAAALKIAEREGVVELTPDHWRVVHYLRKHYLENGTIPAMRHVCNIYGLDERCVLDLFGRDNKKAWRIAGLPNPGEEAKAYL